MDELESFYVNDKVIYSSSNTVHKVKEVVEFNYLIQKWL